MTRYLWGNELMDFLTMRQGGMIVPPEQDDEEEFEIQLPLPGLDDEDEEETEPIIPIIYE